MVSRVSMKRIIFLVVVYILFSVMAVAMVHPVFAQPRLSSYNYGYIDLDDDYRQPRWTLGYTCVPGSQVVISIPPDPIMAYQFKTDDDEWYNQYYGERWDVGKVYVKYSLRDTTGDTILDSVYEKPGYIEMLERDDYGNRHYGFRHTISFDMGWHVLGGQEGNWELGWELVMMREDDYPHMIGDEDDDKVTLEGKVTIPGDEGSFFMDKLWSTMWIKINDKSAGIWIFKKEIIKEHLFIPALFGSPIQLGWLILGLTFGISLYSIVRLTKGPVIQIWREFYASRRGMKTKQAKKPRKTKKR